VTANCLVPRTQWLGFTFHGRIISNDNQELWDGMRLFYF
jgi:hypothetical protein